MKRIILFKLCDWRYFVNKHTIVCIFFNKFALSIKMKINEAALKYINIYKHVRKDGIKRLILFFLTH